MILHVQIISDSNKLNEKQNDVSALKCNPRALRHLPLKSNHNKVFGKWQDYKTFQVPLIESVSDKILQLNSDKLHQPQYPLLLSILPPMSITLQTSQTRTNLLQHLQ